MVQSNIILGATALISSMSSVALAFPVKEKGYDHMALEASLNNAGEDNKSLTLELKVNRLFFCWNSYSHWLNGGTWKSFQ